MDGWMDGLTDGEIFGWLVGCSDRGKYILICRKFFTEVLNLIAIPPLLCN